jgi:hypothetical protein
MPGKAAAVQAILDFSSPRSSSREVSLPRQYSENSRSNACSNNKGALQGAKHPKYRLETFWGEVRTASECPIF